MLTCNIPTRKKKMHIDEWFMHVKSTVCSSDRLSGIQAMNPKGSHVLSVQMQCYPNVHQGVDYFLPNTNHVLASFPQDKCQRDTV